MKNYHIFLAEDDIIIALDIKNILQKAGYNNVSVFTDSNELLNKALQHPPDLVITNKLLLNKTNGIKPAEEFLSSYKVPLLFISAYNPEKFLKDDNNFKWAFVSKPFKDIEITSAVQKLIQNK